MPKDMSEYRKEIDRIDDEIIRLLNERSKSVIEIGKLKKEKSADANLHTAGREVEIINGSRNSTRAFPKRGHSIGLSGNHVGFCH